MAGKGHGSELLDGLLDTRLRCTRKASNVLVQGVVTVACMSAPAVVSLLALIRLIASRHEATAELDRAADLAQEQTVLLMNHQPPTEPLPKLLVSALAVQAPHMDRQTAVTHKQCHTGNNHRRWMHR
ncbi:hypothetical protein MMC07_008977 [Pseudocyphellaria aurata]|nr:hypothetical protein [Pseudocyphellaria aurata]